MAESKNARCECMKFRHYRYGVNKMPVLLLAIYRLNEFDALLKFRYFTL